MIECPPGYHDLVPGSGNCYQISSTKHYWGTSKLKCEEDGAMLACFGNQYERDQLAKACDDCWVGYMWKEGILNDKVYFLICLIIIYVKGAIIIDQRTYIFIRFMEVNGDY